MCSLRLVIVELEALRFVVRPLATAGAVVE